MAKHKACRRVSAEYHRVYAARHRRLMPGDVVIWTPNALPPLVLRVTHAENGRFLGVNQFKAYAAVTYAGSEAEIEVIPEMYKAVGSTN